MFGKKSKTPAKSVERSFGQKLKKFFSKNSNRDDFFDDLEDLLIEGDLGAMTAVEAVGALKTRIRGKKIDDPRALQSELKEILKDHVKAVSLVPESGVRTVFLVLGVNGVGKTTTIAKMAKHLQAEAGTDKIVLAAADTFRAAAIDQLETHGQRLGFRVVRQEPGADPGAVIFDALESAVNRGDEIILADTAGRLHNKSHLVRELQKIDKIIRERFGDHEFQYKTLLVIDATTGQNGLRQAEIFHEAVGVDALVMTKYDSQSKGGTIVTIGKTLGLPVAYVGTGESYDDLEVFNPETYLDELLGLS